MAGVVRGEVYWSDLNPTRGEGPVQRRPLVVLSRAAYNAASGTVIAAVVTSQPQEAGYPLTLRLEGVALDREAWVKIGQIRTLATDRLGERIGRLPPDVVARIVEGLGELLGPED